MKKFPIILFLGIIGFLDVQAQKLPIKLGLKAAPTICWVSPETKHYSYDGVTGGILLGLVADFYFAEHYAFSTGFNFDFLNGKAAYPDWNINGTDTIPGDMHRKYKFIYLDIPYMIKMQTREFGSFSFFGQIGFSTGFRITARARDEFIPGNGGEASTDTKNISSSTSLIRQAVLAGIGFEYHLDENTRIFLGFSYSNSLNNILTGVNDRYDLNEKAQLNYAELNIGVLF